MLVETHFATFQVAFSYLVPNLIAERWGAALFVSPPIPVKRRAGTVAGGCERLNNRVTFPVRTPVRARHFNHYPFRLLNGTGGNMGSGGFGLGLVTACRERLVLHRTWPHVVWTRPYWGPPRPKPPPPPPPPPNCGWYVPGAPACEGSKPSHRLNVRGDRCQMLNGQNLLLASSK
jgi:hypothetical protein